MKVADQNTTGYYNKYLSRLDVWALSLGGIIGWGAFVMPGTTFLPAAGPGGTVVAMMISTLLTLVIGFNYVVLMNRYPGIGGVYAYCKELMGNDHAFLSSWFLCLSYLSLIPQNATMFAHICRILTGNVLQSGFHYKVAGTEVYLTELGVIFVVLVLVGLFAICMKPFLQKIQTVLGVILAIGVLTIAFIIAPHVPLSEAFSQSGTMSASSIRGILTIVILAPWAFVGFEVVSLETAHFNFAIKKTGKLILLAILVGSMIYCVMAFSAILRQPEGIVGWQSYISQAGLRKGIDSVPTFFVLHSIFGKAGLWIIAITAFSAVTSTVICFYRVSARILMNLAEDNILMEQFKKPAFCFLFLMGLSMVVSAFGRTAVSWGVDLSSLGAIVGFGYVSVATYRIAKKEGKKRNEFFGIIGTVIAVCFAAAQLIPGISLIETMKAEAYLLLAFWCLFGFAFYWRAMHADGDGGRRNESITIAALFTLMIFSVVIWYVKKMVAAASLGPISHGMAILYSMVLTVIILFGIIVVLMTHARLKKRQMELETEKIRAIENAQAKSQFLFNMSHDIRTPMNAIMGYTKLALKEPLSPEVRQYLEKIDLSGKHMLNLIKDILEMSRIDSGKIELQEEAADLTSVIEEIRGLFQGLMQEKQLSFEVDLGHIRHSWVYCDKQNLLRVLMSLVSNAYKFTPEGGFVRLFLCEKGAAEQGYSIYEIHIEDNGIGMSEEFVKRMFDAFERERTSTDSGLEGTGLGLTITKSILDLMGASIDVQTAPDKGTQILVEMKLRLAEAPRDFAEEKSERQDAQEKSLDFSKIRLLLVEDNMINMEIAQMILKQAGFKIETAENGQVAVDRISEADAGYYDGVLMDIQMPVMDGYAATRAIRSLDDAKKSNIPIIAMTANAFQEDEEKAFQAGMQAHLAKPIDVAVMLDTISSVLMKATAAGIEEEE